MAQINLLKTTTPVNPTINRMGLFFDENGILKSVDENDLVSNIGLTNPITDDLDRTSIDFYQRLLKNITDETTLDYQNGVIYGDWVIQGSTNDGSTNIFTFKDSDGVPVFSVDSLGNITSTGPNSFETTANKTTDFSVIDDTLYPTVKAVDDKIHSNWEITKEPTGFKDPSLVDVVYDAVNRTITLNGLIEGYWRGSIITSLFDGWVSDPHSVTAADYFFYYDGTDFIWSPDVWTFDMFQIAYVTKAGFGLRECHGLMDYLTHQELHQTLGTYRLNGGDFTNYVTNSTTAINRRPNISSCNIKDEDLSTILPALSTKTYTVRNLTGTGDGNFILNNAEIIPVVGNTPYYNQLSGGNWIQTAFPTNNYGAVFVMAVPVTSDSLSQQYAYHFIQPQLVSGSLTTIQAHTFNSLNFGGITLSEYSFIEKIIIRYTGGNWVIYSSQRLSGTNLTSIAVQAGYLTTVSTTDDLDGLGTSGSPLGIANRNGFIDYSHSGTTQSYTSGNLKILNDGAGTYTLKTYKPLGITELWSTTTNQFDFSELALGDEVMLRVDYNITTSASNQIVNGFLRLDTAGTPYDLSVGTTNYKTVGTYNLIKVLPFYIGNTGTLNNPAELYFNSDAAAAIELKGFYISVNRRHI